MVLMDASILRDVHVKLENKLSRMKSYSRRGWRTLLARFGFPDTMKGTWKASGGSLFLGMSCFYVVGPFRFCSIPNTQ